MPLKSGNLFIGDIQLPDSVELGAEMDNTITVENGAFFISTNDPDHCNPSGFGNEGYYVELRIDPSWRAGMGESACIGISTYGTEKWDVTRTFNAPSSEGSYWIDYWLRLPNTGTKSDKVTKSIEVSRPSIEPATIVNMVANGGTNEATVDFGVDNPNSVSINVRVQYTVDGNTVATDDVGVTARDTTSVDKTFSYDLSAEDSTGSKICVGVVDTVLR